ncbi:HAD-like domain-containing protein [Phellopilus nigrolimitatus]|nr:HAD-like domain-containing protein [Phellopilus nigrolimitatus]
MPRPAIRALLIDLSGTLHIGSTATPAAAAALAHARKAGLVVRFCSNTSQESTRALRERLGGMGFDVRDGELWTSLGALKEVVREMKLQRPYALLSDSAMEEFPEFRSAAADAERHHASYDSVLVAFAPEHLAYGPLNKAFRVLSARPASSPSGAPPLLTTHRAKYLRSPDGELSLGPGPFVSALEEAVGGGLHAHAVGKPGRAFFESVLASIPDAPETEGARWADVAVIGDDVEADLGGGAVELGLWRVLVKTGKYRPGDESRPGVRPPDEVQDSFAAFVDDLVQDRILERVALQVMD